MIFRLKTFIVDVAGDLVTGRFWKAVLKQSLQTALLSAAEAAFKALGRTFRDMGDKLRKQNASPGDESRVEQPTYPRAVPQPAAVHHQDRTVHSAPTVTQLFRPSFEAVARGEASFTHEDAVSSVPTQYGQDVFGMGQDRFSSEQSTTEEDEDPILIRDFDRHMNNLRG